MKTNQKLMEKVKSLLKEKGQKALEIARQSVLQEKIECEPLNEALRYFMEEIWLDVPHPALLSLTCEAVGGNPDATANIGAAIALLAGAADIHDDIIDQSSIKDGKETVFGKFGKDIALLAGDALLFKGLMMLHEACKRFPKNKKQEILRLSKQAFFKIGSAEAKETSFKGKFDLPAEEYFKIIENKTAVAEATAKIGAIIGGGTREEIAILGHYGKILSILMTIRDEFIDIFELKEIKNRVENECLPLPILFTFKDPKKQNKIVYLLKKGELTEKNRDKILDIVMNAVETQELKEKMIALIKEAHQQLKHIKRNKETLQLILDSTLEGLK
jgi:geranylgeranyl pyrophosphate synthase